MGNYIFSDFKLIDGKVLLKKEEKLKVPPKEMAVLHLLVIRAGEIVSKGDIIREVWKGVTVSDESLTRCIYALRQTLVSPGNISIIETIYGVGYRLATNVEHIDFDPEDTSAIHSMVIALLPFRLLTENQQDVIYHYILENGRNGNNARCRFLPAALTAGIESITERFEDFIAMGATHILSGKEYRVSGSSVLRIEITDTRNIAKVFHRNIIMNDDPLTNLININHESGLLINSAHGLFCKKIPGIIKKIENLDIEKSADADSISRSYSMADEMSTEGADKNGAQAYLSMAGCYFSLYIMGCIDKDAAKTIILPLIKWVLSCEPFNSLANTFNTLLNDEINTELTGENLRLKVILSPLNGNVYYEYALFLAMNKKWDKALNMVMITLRFDPNHFPSSILRITICYFQELSSFSLKIISEMKGQDTRQDILLTCLDAIINDNLNERARAERCLGELQKYRSECLFVDLVFNNIRKEKQQLTGNLSALGNVSLPLAQDDTLVCFPFIPEPVS